MMTHSPLRFRRRWIVFFVCGRFLSHVSGDCVGMLVVKLLYPRRYTLQIQEERDLMGVPPELTWRNFHKDNPEVSE